MAALRTIVSVVMLMFVVALYIHHWNVFRVYDTAVQYLLRTGPRPALVCCSDGEFVIHSNTSYDLPPHHGIPSLRTEDITTTTIDTPSLSLHCSLHDFGREMTHRCAKRSPAEAPVRSIPQPSAAVVHEAARTKHVTGNVTTVVLRRHGSIRNHIYHEMAEAMAVFRLLRLAGSAGPPSERWPPAQLVLVDGEAPWLPATENIFHAITQREILYIHNELPSENTKFRRPIHDQSHGLAGGEGRIITSYKVAPPGEMLAVVEPVSLVSFVSILGWNHENECFTADTEWPLWATATTAFMLQLWCDHVEPSILTLPLTRVYYACRLVTGAAFAGDCIRTRTPTPISPYG